MNQEELQKLLDSLDEGPLGNRSEKDWDTSIRQKGVVQPQFFTEEARAKWKANPAQNTKQWRESRSKYLTGRKQPEHSERMKGEGNSTFGTGNTYIELTTGFTGTAYEMAQKFNISMANLGTYAKNDRPMKSGVAKGKHFRIVDGPKRKVKKVTAFYIELTTNTKGSSAELGDKFNVPLTQIIFYAKRNAPIKKGKLKGLHFKKL